MQYLGIAADEPERIEKHTKPGFVLPLVKIGWTEADCRKWCEENDLLSPIYTTASRGGGAGFATIRASNNYGCYGKPIPICGPCS